MLARDLSAEVDPSADYLSVDVCFDPAPFTAIESSKTAEGQETPELSRLEEMQNLIGEYQFRTGKGWTEEVLTEFLYQCQQYCFWPLITRICHSFIGSNAIFVERQLEIKVIEIAAYAAFQQGHISLAQSFIRRGLLIQSSSSYLLHLQTSLSNWIDLNQQYPLGFCLNQRPESENSEPELYLQILGEHHFESFISIYDSETAVLCCLPDFMDQQDWLHWLEDERKLSDQLTFAVMHSEFGMLGSVSLVVHDAAGFFYYWIGQEFRGYSFGPMAVQLLLENAMQMYGLETFYAKVFEENHASRRGLSKLGFEELPIRASGKFETERYYILGDVADLDSATEKMYQFYSKIRCWKPFTRPLMPAVISVK